MSEEASSRRASLSSSRSQRASVRSWESVKGSFAATLSGVGMESIRLELIGWETTMSKRSRKNSIVRDIASEMSARS